MSLLYSIHNGEPVMSTKAMCLLLGVGEDEMAAELKRQGGNPDKFRVPVEWVKRGRRRTKEYAAHTGRDDIKGAIDYYAHEQGASDE